MSKEYEKIRQQISKQYKEEVIDLKQNLKLLKQENIELKQKVCLLEQQLEEKSEWIERMQEYCNLTNEELKTLVESEQSKEELRQLFLGMSGFLNQYR